MHAAVNGLQIRPGKCRSTEDHSKLWKCRSSTQAHCIPTSRNSLLTCIDSHEFLVKYPQAWKWQRDRVTELLEGKEIGLGTLLLLQHEAVYTLGAGSTSDFLNFDVQNPPLPLYRTERGGEVTFHGPGQLVLYPILNLRLLNPDLHWYLRAMEDVVIRALSAVSGIQGHRIDDLTGVWVEGAKVAAIGIRARRWISYHGLALNVTTDLQPYAHIVPCGIANKPVTSVKQILTRQGAVCSSDSQLVSQYAAALLTAFEEVFHVDLDIQKPCVEEREKPTGLGILPA